MEPRDSMEQCRRSRRRALGVLALVGIACMLALAAPAPADPSRSRGDSPQAFLSGGERSLVILREISEVLQRIDSKLDRMDARLERMDARLEQMDGKLAGIIMTAGASQPAPLGARETPRGRDH